MILQNISKAIREQNYYAVALEFVIVVLGVVIGFQINAWAHGREVAAREEQYLDELLADMRGMIEYMEQLEGVLEYEAALGRTVQLMRSCPEDETAWTEARRTLSTHRLRTAAYVVDATYEEMVASGALARLEDAALKAQLKRTYALLHNNQRTAQASNQRLAEAASAVIVSVVPFAPASDRIFGIAVEPDFDLRSLCGDMQFQNALLDLQHARHASGRLNAGFLQVLRETESMLVDRTETGP